MGVGVGGSQCLGACWSGSHVGLSSGMLTVPIDSSRPGGPCHPAVRPRATECNINKSAPTDSAPVFVYALFSWYHRDTYSLWQPNLDSDEKAVYLGRPDREDSADHNLLLCIRSSLKTVDTMPSRHVGDTEVGRAMPTRGHSVVVVYNSLGLDVEGLMIWFLCDLRKKAFSRQTNESWSCSEIVSVLIILLTYSKIR